MEIGRKIYYEISTGDPVYPALESCSNGVLTTKNRDFTVYPFLVSLNPVLYDFVQLAYGERETELQNMGSMHVDPTTKALTIHPRLTIASDKAQITANGTDKATVAVTVQDTINPHAISFSVNGGAPVVVNTANGIAMLPVTTTVPGTYTITATSDIYGTNSVTVKGV